MNFRIDSGGMNLLVKHGPKDTVVLRDLDAICAIRFSIPITTMDRMCDLWLKNRDPKELKKSLKMENIP